jgi:hypothetical protein
MKVEPASSVKVKVFFTEAADAKAVWCKYDSVSGWENYSAHSQFSSDRKSVEIELTDGGKGDADGVANGVIVDPGGLGIFSGNGIAGSEVAAAGCFIDGTVSSANNALYSVIVSMMMLLASVLIFSETMTAKRAFASVSNESFRLNIF